MSTEESLITIIEDLVTIIDYCNEMAARIRSDWTDPRTECRAIFDVHDMAHALTGGDVTRAPWNYAKGWAEDEDDYGTAAWADVIRRFDELHSRLMKDTAS